MLPGCEISSRLKKVPVLRRVKRSKPKRTRSSKVKVTKLDGSEMSKRKPKPKDFGEKSNGKKGPLGGCLGYL